MPTKADTSRLLASLDETLANPDPFPHPSGLEGAPGGSYYTDPHDPVFNREQMASLEAIYGRGDPPDCGHRSRILSFKDDYGVLHGMLIDHTWGDITLDDWSIVEACRHIRGRSLFDDAKRGWWLAGLQRRSQARINLGVGGWYPYERMESDGT